MGDDTLTARAEAIRARSNAVLEAHLAECEAPDALARAMAHAALGPAKRIRSILLVLAADCLSVEVDVAVRAAAAIEVVHAASLVLDDLPAMDDATERRGAPPVHIAFGEATAILAAISLLNEGYKLLNSIAPISADARAQAVDRLVAAVGVAGLTSGQWNDLYPASDGGLDAITRTHAGKTGALFAASLAIAGCLADRPPEMIAALDKAGRAIGVAFQGYDDLLDRYAARAVIGKDTGLDEQRKTIADQMDRATAIAWCEAQLDDGLRHLAAAGLAETDLTAYIRSLAVRLAAPLCKTELAAASQP